jgi:hypothetical protein
MYRLTYVRLIRVKALNITAQCCAVAPFGFRQLILRVWAARNFVLLKRISRSTASRVRFNGMRGALGGNEKINIIINFLKCQTVLFLDLYPDALQWKVLTRKNSNHTSSNHIFYTCLVVAQAVCRILWYKLSLHVVYALAAKDACTSCSQPLQLLVLDAVRYIVDSFLALPKSNSIPFHQSVST